MDPLIQVKNISKSFGQTRVLDGISLSIDKGEILAIIGPSGSGKSTLIRCLNGLEKVDSGRVNIGGTLVESTQSVAGRVGMVFQQFNLFPHYTVLNNIVRPLETVKKLPAREARSKARALLEQVRLEDKEDQYPRSLSGGQQQRLAIARALSMTPDIMLFDEPTSSLDPELAFEVFETIRTIASRHMTMILVTHQMNMVKNFANRVLFLEKGNILFDGSFESLMASENSRIQQFLKKIYP
ncbi:amino acid ABC transporter ATP-binding protein [Desulfospira joergensenii]|uniref:amino acid ABC transporter ATP-binding protein n=1 Tax=Desulfospira joergensenii TaxID=53329 RepID=UPI0003B389B9|nr:amino acid ABC transporter ATP-binding protein [Desulfospira joergensenii]